MSVDNSKQMPNSYEEAAKIVITSMEELGEDELEIFIGSNKFTPSQIITEVKNRTAVGELYVGGYLAGCKFF
jgi:hypothetical protein